MSERKEVSAEIQSECEQLRYRCIDREPTDAEWKELYLNGWNRSLGRISALQSSIDGLREELERERVRLAGCGVAALGYGEDLSKDAYGWSASYQDVLSLRQKSARLEEENKRLAEKLAETEKYLGDTVDNIRTHGVRP